jgi:hypothetical protein
VERWVVGHPEVEVLDVETTYLDAEGVLDADPDPDPDDDPDDEEEDGR